MDLLLSPHNDDEALFAAYTCLRYRPHVIVCLRSVKQETAYGFQHRPDFIATGPVREAESAAACALLGCSFEQWDFPDTDPDWAALEDELLVYGALVYNDRVDRIFAPAVEAEGHPDHNRIGEIAVAVFGARVTAYLTYTNGRARSRGTAVAARPGWPEKKKAALACYESQMRLASTAHHFAQPLDEFYEAAAAPVPSR